MKRVLLLLALAGCGFAQRHPGITVGITTGSIGFFACEISVDKIGTCSAIGAATGLVLGGITGLLSLIGGSSANQAPPEEPEAESRRIETTTEPPPGLPDAGVVSDAGVADAIGP